jgi:hypothetical protein
MLFILKRIFLLLFFIPFLFSCSDDDTNNIGGSSSGPLLSQVVMNYPNNDTFVKLYTYKDRNKLKQIDNSDGTIELYTYTDDLITKVEYLFSNSAYRDEIYYSYDSQKRLIEEIHLYYYNSSGTRTVFTHNGSGSVSYVTYSGNLGSQTEQTYHGSFMLGAKGEILKKTETHTETGELRTYSYSFDTEKSAYLNIKDGSVGFEYILNGPNNVLSMSMKDDNGNVIYSYTSTFNFNNDGYPNIEFRTSQSGTAEVHYQYK